MELSCTQVDDTLGPYAHSCRGGFDFTLLFEELVFSVLPTIALLLVIPFRIRYLLRREIKVKGSLTAYIKPVRTAPKLP